MAKDTILRRRMVDADQKFREIKGRIGLLLVGIFQELPPQNIAYIILLAHTLEPTAWLDVVVIPDVFSKAGFLLFLCKTRCSN